MICAVALPADQVVIRFECQSVRVSENFKSHSTI